MTECDYGLQPLSGFPLPSTGRGIEGEGWEVLPRWFVNERATSFSLLTPALSPLRGEGVKHTRRPVAAGFNRTCK